MARRYRLSTPAHRTLAAVFAGLAIAASGSSSHVLAQADPVPSPASPDRVVVRPTVSDAEIAERITRILEASGRINAPEVDVREGVVFLQGQALSAEWSAWAEALALRTEAVVAVINNLDEVPGPALDFTPAWSEVDALWRDSVQALPLIAVVLMILTATFILALLTVRVGRWLLRNRLPSQMLTSVVVWLIAAPVILIGIYVALRVAGLTQLALTVLGGTGIAGLIIGIAFRDIAENFLASVLLSIRNPFRSGDRIEVAGLVGVVQRITTRGTILMTLDGNHLQIPNSTVYKSTITNFSSNPKRRMDFAIGVGYDAVITEAQAAIRLVLSEHPVVLDDPEPLVLVEELGAATVDMRAYFWFNGSQYEGLKLKSALIRLSKRALDERGISMPDEAREVIFPQGVPIIAAGAAASVLAQDTRPVQVAQKVETKSDVPDPLSTASEGDLANEDEQIYEQARHSRLPEDGEDLLEPAP